MKELYNKKDRQLHSLPPFGIPYAPYPPFPRYHSHQYNNLSYYPPFPPTPPTPPTLSYPLNHQHSSFLLDQNKVCQSICLPEDQIINIVKTQYHNTIDKDEFISNCKVNDCIKVLKNHYNRKDFITLCHKKYLYICPNCEGWRIISTRKKDDVLCIKCTNSKYNESKRKQRDQYRRVDPSSTIRHDYLSHNELSKRAKICGSKNRKLTKAINKVKKAIQTNSNISKDVEFDRDDPISTVMNDAIKAIQSNKDSLSKEIKNDILRTLIKTELGSCAIDDTISTNIENLSKTLLEQIEHHALVLSGKEKRVRFSSQIMRMALCQFMKSPSSYEQLKRASITIMPSIIQLKKMKSKLTIREGNCAAIYGNYRSDDDIGDDAVGMLMCDEMHLKNGIYTNIQSGRTVGFAETRPNALELVDIIQEIMDDAVVSADSSEESVNDNNKTAINPGEVLENDDSVDNETSQSQSVPSDDSSEKSSQNQKNNLVTQVNLWKFKTMYNKTRHLEFFFNNGSLSSSELLRQLLHVISSLKMVGAKVIGFIADAGGNNAGLFSLLRDRKVISKIEGLLDDELRVFRDPTDPGNLIAVCLCMTHGLKTIRNQLYSSYKNGTNSFMSVEGVRFGWESIERCWKRDC